MLVFQPQFQGRTSAILVVPYDPSRPMDSLAEGPQRAIQTAAALRPDLDLRIIVDVSLREVPHEAHLEELLFMGKFLEADPQQQREVSQRWLTQLYQQLPQQDWTLLPRVFNNFRERHEMISSLIYGIVSLLEAPDAIQAHHERTRLLGEYQRVFMSAYSQFSSEDSVS